MNKKNLSMNTRDRNLLIFLGLIIVAFVAYMYVITPALANGDNLKVSLESINQEITLAQDNISKLPILRQSERKLKEQLVEKYKGFFYDLNQEKILYQIDTLIAASGISITSYVPTVVAVGGISVEKGVYTPLQYPLLDLAARTNPSLVPVQEPLAQDNGVAVDPNATVDPNAPIDPNATVDPNAAADPNAVATDGVPFTDISLSIGSSNYASILNFIGQLEKMNKTIIVKNISLIKMDTTGVQGQILISCYSMPKLDDSDKDYLKFLPVNAIGKTSLF
jgi:type IV pilus assembly protein PilO